MNALAQPLVFDDEPETFTFDQLSDSAKSRARENYLNSEPYDYDWWDFVYEDALAIAELMGIEVDSRDVKMMSGKTYQEPSIHFSGFSSQGDGACFEGRWSRPDKPAAMVRAVRSYAPLDKTLHKIALALAKVAKRGRHFGYMSATSKHTGHYCHEHSVTIEIECLEPDDIDDWPKLKYIAWNAVHPDSLHGELGSDVTEALRAFMKWIYSSLESEWNFMHEDDYVDEYLSDQDTLYDEDGDEI